MFRSKWALIYFSLALLSATARGMDEDFQQRRKRDFPWAGEDSKKNYPKKKVQRQNGAPPSTDLMACNTLVVDDQVDLISILPHEFFIPLFLNEAKEDLSRLLSFSSISKHFYKRTTGYEMRLTGTLWKTNRIFSDTLLNWRGIQICEFESGPAYAYGGRKNKKDILINQCSSYFLKGTQVQKLPRYIVEALRTLDIKDQFHLKDFINKGEQRFADFAKRFTGTAIQDLRIEYCCHWKAGEQWRDKEVRETSNAIDILNNISHSKIKRIYFINFLFGSEDMLHLQPSFANTNLEILGLSINGYDEPSEAAWAHWGKILRSANSLRKIYCEDRTILPYSPFKEPSEQSSRWIAALLKELEGASGTILALTRVPLLNNELKKALNTSTLETLIFEVPLQIYDSCIVAHFFILPNIGTIAKEAQLIKFIKLPRFNGPAQRLLWGDTLEKYIDDFAYELHQNPNASANDAPKITIIYPFDPDEVSDNKGDFNEQVRFMNYLSSKLPSRYILHGADGPYIPRPVN